MDRVPFRVVWSWHWRVSRSTWLNLGFLMHSSQAYNLWSTQQVNSQDQIKSRICLNLNVGYGWWYKTQFIQDFLFPVVSKHWPFVSMTWLLCLSYRFCGCNNWKYLAQSIAIAHIYTCTVNQINCTRFFGVLPDNGIYEFHNGFCGRITTKNKTKPPAKM